MGRILLTAIVCFICSTGCYAYVGYRYIGCYQDKTARILEGSSTSGSMTVEKCVQKCTYEGDYYAGVEHATQCFCGKHLQKYTKLDDKACTTKCDGNSEQICGGSWKISVYTTYVNYLGCYQDHSLRLLEGQFIKDESKMTTEYCINYCKTFGKRFALTQNSNECFCGNHMRRYAKKPNSDCSMNCEGDSSEKCGGAWRGSVYAI